MRKGEAVRLDFEQGLTASWCARDKNLFSLCEGLAGITLAEPCWYIWYVMEGGEYIEPSQGLRLEESRYEVKFVAVMEENIKEKDRPTILACLAHPDDESFGMGGTLALYAQRGVDVHLICATRGEVGEVEPEMLKGYQSIGDLRQNELRCAAEKLGLAGVHFLGYRDSGMTGSENNKDTRALLNAPLEEVAGKVVHYIRELRPQVVLTFDPIGGYRHPDHIAIHNATVMAFHAAGDPEAYPDDLAPYQPKKLYYHTMPRKFMRWVVWLLPLFGKDPRHWGQNEDIDLVSVMEEDFPVHARIDYGPVAELKAEASACHASQGGMGFVSGPVRWAFRLVAGKDGFMRAYPEPEPGLRERDLFAGVNGSGE